MKSFVGITLYGHCNGFFGRSSYENKVVESQGRDWIVCRTSDVYDADFPVFASFQGWEDMMEELLDKWSKNE